MIVITILIAIGIAASFKSELPKALTTIVVGSKRKYKHASMQCTLILLFSFSCNPSPSLLFIKHFIIHGRAKQQIIFAVLLCRTSLFKEVRLFCLVKKYFQYYY